MVVWDTAEEDWPPIVMLTDGWAAWSTEELYEVCSVDGFMPGLYADPAGDEFCCPETCHSSVGVAGHRYCMQPLDCPPCREACSCGDVDRSGGPVDLSDFATFAVCYGLAGPISPGCDAPAFECADLNGDRLIDLSDFATFAVWYGIETTLTPHDCTQP
jgi:hypothetical protein